jgi:hypothetical protein
VPAQIQESPRSAPAPSAPAPRLPAPARPPEPAASTDPIYLLLLETVGRMSSCFSEADMPLAVTRLRAMVTARDYSSIRAAFPELWAQLNEHHKSRGLTMQPRVSHTFRTIETIIKNL